MKINQHKPVLSGILLCCWFLWGCEKEVIVPDLDGNIVGYLYTLDEFGLCDDHSGVKVMTRGLDGTYTEYSDEDGRYELKSVPAGTYELDFTKEGFVSQKLLSVRHLGGRPTILGYNGELTMQPWTRLYKTPETTIQNIYLENDTLFAEFNLAGTPKWSISVMLYFSLQNGFQKSSAIIFSQNFMFQNGISKSPLLKNALPFEPGQIVYLRGAVLSDGHTSCATIDSEGNYINCSTGTIFYPILGDESNQFSFIFPD